jgi:hypothetical protein
MPQKFLHENPKKRLRKSPTEENRKNTNKLWGTTPNHLYILLRFIQGLASARSSFSLTRSHHEALKLVLEILRKIGREIAKQNELGFKRWLPSPEHLGYMEASQKTKIPPRPKLGFMPTKGTLGNCLCNTIERMPSVRTSLSLDASLAIPTRVLRFEAFGTLRPQIGQTGFPNRSGRFWPDSHAQSSASALGLNRVTQWFSGEPLQAPRTWCSLRQSPLMTRLPQSPGSTFVLRLNQEAVHDFILLFLPPCCPHLTLLATGSLEPSLLVFSTPGGLIGNDISCLFFTSTNTSQAATCTCNT